MEALPKPCYLHFTLMLHDKEDTPTQTFCIENMMVCASWTQHLRCCAMVMKQQCAAHTFEGNGKASVHVEALQRREGVQLCKGRCADALALAQAQHPEL